MTNCLSFRRTTGVWLRLWLLLALSQAGVGGLLLPPGHGVRVGAAADQRGQGVLPVTPGPRPAAAPLPARRRWRGLHQEVPMQDVPSGQSHHPQPRAPVPPNNSLLDICQQSRPAAPHSDPHEGAQTLQVRLLQQGLRQQLLPLAAHEDPPGYQALQV